jgi:hypothetical protein
MMFSCLVICSKVVENFMNLLRVNFGSIWTYSLEMEAVPSWVQCWKCSLSSRTDSVHVLFRPDK